MNIRPVTVIATAIVLTYIGCKERQSDGNALYSCDSFTVGRDSITYASGVTLVADTSDTGSMRFYSGIAVIDMLFNAAADLSDNATANDIFLSCLAVDTGQCRHALEKMCSPDGYIKANDSILCRPISSGNPAWVTAAWELYKLTGDRDWLTYTCHVGERSLQTDLDVAFNRGEGLMRGIPASLSAIPASFPLSMSMIDRFAIMSLRANVDYQGAFRALDEATRACGETETAYGNRADSIALAINSSMWIPNLGYYSQSLYGELFPLAVQAVDNRGSSMAVLHHIASAPMAAAIVSHSPILPDGVPQLYPALSDSAYAYRTDVQSAWTIAAAMTSNDCAVTYGLAVLAARELPHIAAGRKAHPTVAATLYRGLLGMNLSPDGITFSPFIPSFMDGNKRLTGFRYRNATIDITVHGTGDIISTFAIDGKVSSDNFIPATLDGHHNVSITLAGNSRPGGSVSMADRDKTLPRAPGKENLVYINGAPMRLISGNDYNIRTPAGVTTVALVPVDNLRTEGFAETPLTYIPPRRIISVQAKDIARPGTRLIDNVDINSRFVQSTQWKNRSLRFHVEIPDSGKYLIRAGYLNGLGIVNPSRKCALRELKINNIPQGTLIFPQRPPKDWSHKSDWRRLTSLTNMIPVTMQRGVNTISIDLLNPPFTDFNTDNNVTLIDKIEIINCN